MCINVHMGRAMKWMKFIYNLQYFLRWTTRLWKTELLIFTKNFKLDLQGLLSSAVLGHTLVGALVSEVDLLDPEGRSVLDPNRKSIMKPADLRAWLSLHHTWQSHCLANQGFQERGRWLNPGLSWGQKQISLNTSLLTIYLHISHISHVFEVMYSSVI